MGKTEELTSLKKQEEKKNNQKLRDLLRNTVKLHVLYSNRKTKFIEISASVN